MQTVDLHVARPRSDRGCCSRWIFSLTSQWHVSHGIPLHVVKNHGADLKVSKWTTWNHKLSLHSDPGYFFSPDSHGHYSQESHSQASRCPAHWRLRAWCACGAVLPPCWHFQRPTPLSWRACCGRIVDYLDTISMTYGYPTHIL